MSAWEQWGGKRPMGGMLNGAQDALNGLLNSSPLSSTASTASVDGDVAPKALPSFSLARLWDSQKKKTSVSDADALENGEGGAPLDGEEQDSSPLFPLFRRKSPKESTTGFATLNWGTRLKYCVALSLLAVLFFGMSSIFIPLIVLRPAKFALSFTLGSICGMGAVAMLKGPMTYARDLMLPKNLVLTTAYVLTLGLTLYSCLVLGSFVMVVGSSLCQLVTLFVFVVSALPGGGASIKTFTTLFTKAARRMVQAFVRLLR